MLERVPGTLPLDATTLVNTQADRASVEWRRRLREWFGTAPPDVRRARPAGGRQAGPHRPGRHATGHAGPGRSAGPAWRAAARQRGLVDPRAAAVAHDDARRRPPRGARTGRRCPTRAAAPGRRPTGAHSGRAVSNTTRSARLPTSIEPSSWPRPMASAPRMVASSSARWAPGCVGSARRVLGQPGEQRRGAQRRRSGRRRSRCRSRAPAARRADQFEVPAGASDALAEAQVRPRARGHGHVVGQQTTSTSASSTCTRVGHAARAGPSAPSAARCTTGRRPVRARYAVGSLSVGERWNVRWVPRRPGQVAGRRHELVRHQVVADERHPSLHEAVAAGREPVEQLGGAGHHLGGGRGERSLRPRPNPTGRGATRTPTASRRGGHPVGVGHGAGLHHAWSRRCAPPPPAPATPTARRRRRCGRRAAAPPTRRSAAPGRRSSGIEARASRSPVRCWWASTKPGRDPPAAGVEHGGAGMRGAQVGLGTDGGDAAAAHRDRRVREARCGRASIVTTRAGAHRPERAASALARSGAGT